MAIDNLLNIVNEQELEPQLNAERILLSPED